MVAVDFRWFHFQSVRVYILTVPRGRIELYKHRARKVEKMGKLKQEEIAKQEDYDNLVAWLAAHIDTMDDERFYNIVGNPVLLANTVEKWLSEGEPSFPQPASGHVALKQLRNRRGLRKSRRARLTPYVIVILVGALAGLVPFFLDGVFNGISAIGFTVSYFTMVALAVRSQRGTR